MAGDCPVAEAAQAVMDHGDGRLNWVRTGDGRLAAFEADHISRELFAATEQLGWPDAFLSRELTDTIIHFLEVECEGTIPTTAQVVEVAVKVLRELGHSSLAQAFAQHSALDAAGPGGSEPISAGPAAGIIDEWIAGDSSPVALAWRLSRHLLREYSLARVYSRDLAAAHRSRLLILGNLDCPFDPAGHVLSSSQVFTGDPLARLLEARRFVGEVVCLDHPDHLLADLGLSPSDAAVWVGRVCLGLELTGLRAVLNLNSSSPPPGAVESSGGPLFGNRESDPGVRILIADAMLDALSAGSSVVRVDWHLGAADFLLDRSSRLLHLCRWMQQLAPVTCVFDRPRRPVPLAEGLDRQHPATLMTIGLNLVRLAEQPGVQAYPDLFLQKLGSLVRLAFSAATQKRDFLRHHRPELNQGFLLDRARLVIVPVGLETTVRRLIGQGLCESSEALGFARRLLQRLAEAVQAEGRHRAIDCVIDSADRFWLNETGGEPAGLTSWDPQTPLRQQVRAAGLLHSATRSGTGAILVRDGYMPAAEAIADCLRAAWQQGDVVRIQLVRSSSSAPPEPMLFEPDPGEPGPGKPGA